MSKLREYSGRLVCSADMCTALYENAVYVSRIRSPGRFPRWRDLRGQGHEN